MNKRFQKSWQLFESLVAQIQKETAPDAIVRRNQHLVGKSGISRQLDVTISKKIGLHQVLIVLECKDYKYPVPIKEVGNFATTLQDVGASNGVMVSSSGFTNGAVALGKEKAISLHSLRQAQALDWRDILSENAFLKIYVRYERNLVVDIEVEAAQGAFPRPDKFIIYQEGKQLGTIDQVLFDSGRHFGPDSVGLFKVDVIPPKQLHIAFNGQLILIRKFVVKGEGVVLAYLINIRLSRGIILEDARTGNAIYKNIKSDILNFKELISRTRGKQLTPKEYAQIPKRLVTTASPHGFPLDKAHFGMVVFTQGQENIEKS